jgi:exo-beta-1,3-glucanase (GH17 family)
MSKSDNDSFAVNSHSSAAVYERRTEYLARGSLGLLGTDFSRLSHEDKISLFHEILKQKIHGISFSPYVDGQSPGTDISEDQIWARLGIIQPYTHWIRSFSCIEGNQEIPRIAHENGLKTMVGVGLSDDMEANEIELANGIEIAKAGHADILAVGNEILLRKDLTEDELIDYIHRAQAAVPDVPVSYVDAYFLFENHPRVAEACDVQRYRPMKMRWNISSGLTSGRSRTMSTFSIFHRLMNPGKSAMKVMSVPTGDCGTRKET